MPKVSIEHLVWWRFSNFSHGESQLLMTVFVVVARGKPMHTPWQLVEIAKESTQLCTTMYTTLVVILVD
jgi:hypothetical protein